MILYLDCRRGINAVAALAALVDAGAPSAEIARQLRSLPGDIALESSEPVIEGFRVRRVELSASQVPAARNLQEVAELIGQANLSADTQTLVIGIYRRLADAEARVHGSTAGAVTFHEVGTARSLLAVLGTAIALEVLGVRQVIASPIPAGAGMIETYHGPLPVPAPATLELLRGMPLLKVERQGELITPTGAAIIGQLASSFGSIPTMTVERVGYGTDDRRSPAILTRVIGGSTVPSVPTGRTPDEDRA